MSNINAGTGLPGISLFKSPSTFKLSPLPSLLSFILRRLPSLLQVFHSLIYTLALRLALDRNYHTTPYALIAIFLILLAQIYILNPILATSWEPEKNTEGLIVNEPSWLGWWEYRLVNAVVKKYERLFTIDVFSRRGFLHTALSLILGKEKRYLEIRDHQIIVISKQVSWLEVFGINAEREFLRLQELGPDGPGKDLFAKWFVLAGGEIIILIFLWLPLRWFFGASSNIELRKALEVVVGFEMKSDKEVDLCRLRLIPDTNEPPLKVLSWMSMWFFEALKLFLKYACWRCFLRILGGIWVGSVKFRESKEKVSHEDSPLPPPPPPLIPLHISDPLSTISSGREYYPYREWGLVQEVERYGLTQQLIDYDNERRFSWLHEDVPDWVSNHWFDHIGELEGDAGQKLLNDAIKNMYSLNLWETRGLLE